MFVVFMTIISTCSSDFRIASMFLRFLRDIVLKDFKVCFVGGDHSITYPLFKAFREKNAKPFLIVFDAHADCMPSMKEPTHEEFLRRIIEDGFDPAKVMKIIAVAFVFVRFASTG